jgi:hypothetical protein
MESAKPLNYQDLRSIVGSSKSSFALSAATESFQAITDGERPYITPTFAKDSFDEEQPQFLLVSAVGASGKTALANKLSSDIGLPVLNLGKHPPVADNTLTGILTTSFPYENLAGVLIGLKNGTYGVIVDGIDEGRSKVNEQAFNAFLEDLIRLSSGSQKTTFVLLGRTQALIDCWVYLQGRGVSVGLASIEPFAREKAVEYIDTFAKPPVSGQREQYNTARDLILAKLEGAFSGQAAQYLSFIGYPPVLDAIATLLKEEKNYQKLAADLQESGSQGVQTDLLFKISAYLLKREKVDKVLPNVVQGLIAEFPAQIQGEIKARAYDFQEQSARLVSHCLGTPCALEIIPQPGLNLQYEEQVESFLADHPFLAGGGREFRNAIFEAVCLAILTAGGKPEQVELIRAYATNRRSNLYLIQMLAQVAHEVFIEPSLIDVVVGAALEFRSTGSRAEITIEATNVPEPSNAPIQLEVLIEVVSLNTEGDEREFVFKSIINGAEPVNLGPRLAACFIDIPCKVSISGGDEIELTAPVEVSARSIELGGSMLVVRTAPKIADKQVDLEADDLSTTLTSLKVDPGADFSIRVNDPSSHHYPLVRYVKQRGPVIDAPEIRGKYLKLRTILTHFRSHSRGELKKLKAKVENDRVGGNEKGLPVLNRLIFDGILVPQGIFYVLDPPKLSQHLGVSWVGLKKGEVNPKLLAYLGSI